MGSTSLSAVTVSQLDRAARDVVSTSLGVSAAETVVVVADAGSARMGDALARAIAQRGAEARMIWLEDLGARPLPAIPEAIWQRFEGVTASAFVASAPPDELTMRRWLLAEITSRQLRHAHMPGISALAFARGLGVDYDVVAGHGMRLAARLGWGRRVVCSSRSGTLLVVRTGLTTRWMPQLGQLLPGRWGNLPAGALYGVPEHVEGIFVADAAAGAASTATRPVSIEVEDGRVRKVRVPGDPALERALREHMAATPNGDRVGLVAIGCNYGIAEPTGEAIVDQNRPGLHLALGATAADVTGLAWRSAGSLPLCSASSSVLVDGEPIVRDGTLVQPS